MISKSANFARRLSWIYAKRKRHWLAEEIKEKTDAQVLILNAELTSEHIIGEFILAPGQPPQVRTSKTLETIFGTFRPHHIGVIDYHGPHRTYGRETLQGINLNLDAIAQQRSIHALYNYGNKYANVKSEMAASRLFSFESLQSHWLNKGWWCMVFPVKWSQFRLSRCENFMPDPFSMPWLLRCLKGSQFLACGAFKPSIDPLKPSGDLCL